MGDSDQSNGPIRIDLEDGLTGEQVGTTDYFFVKIGEAVPLKGDDSNYDLERLPCQPLAVSEHFRLMFVAHSSGFFVARTKDVIESAKEFKEKGSGSLVQQLSLVDVSIGRVHILALSTDNSTVAASVAHDIRFFSVYNFLNKEVKQTFSCSLNDSAFVKDMRWITSSKDSFVVLSNTGDLYDGKVDSPLKHVMDCVEAVDCGVKGNFIAVARKNVLSILSIKFEEWISISLSFTPWIADSEPSCSVKVDSVKCVRPDSIIIGCFQLTEDGREENYLLQVIGSKHGEITAGCSEFVVQSFYDIYQGLIDDIVPFGNGPYLLLAYLEQCQLAINANKKNTDQHIMLLGWSVNDDKNEAVVVDIERDNSVPRIELQENGDDNLLLGLCVDKVSIYQEVGVQHGVEERTELSPYCVLICLTLEGKLVLFHVASLAGSEVSTEVVSAVLDEGDSSLKQPAEEGSTVSHGFLAGSEVSESEVSTDVVSAVLDEGDSSLKQPVEEGSTVLDEGDSSLKQPVEEGSTLSHGFLAGSVVSESEVSTEVVSAALDEGDSFLKQPVEKGSTLSHGFQKLELDKASQVSESLKSKPIANSNQMAQTENFNKDPEVESVANLKSLKSNVKQMVPKVDLNQDANSDNKTTSEQQTNLGQKTAGHGSNIGSFMVNSHSAASGLSNYNTSDKTTVMTKVLWNTNSPRDSQRPSYLLPGETFSIPKGSDLSSFSASSSTDGVGYKSQINTMGGTNVHSASVPARIDGKPSSVQGGNGVPAFNSASMPVQSGGQLTTVQAANMQPASVASSNLSLHANTTAGKSSRMFHPSNEQHGTSLKLGTSNSDLSKQFSNINEMTKELDLLLRSIEEAGGFRDACTRLLQSSIEAVEEGMDILSKKCKLWMCQLDEHLEEVHYLLNKTIQVVARKIYMEGIYKQAADSRYWDLWNRQKLNSELELKRQHILSLNQDLTYQLIELERHFNGLELKKFSQYGGRRIDHEAFQSRYGPSRQLQSLHSLHTAISSQLVAAENLSERLSKQMAALNLNSLPNEQKNVKELFETIGIPYDTSFGSPDMKGFVKTPSGKKLFSDSATNKDHSRRIQASAMKNCEPETARRRRDSLDQSWTRFEPPKTTIKRMLLKELPKPNWNGSFSSMNKDKVETSVLKESASQRRDAGIPSIVFPASKAKAGALDSHLKFKEGLEQAFKWADSLRAPTQLSEPKSPVLPKNSISAVPSWPASQLSPAMMHGSSTETKDMAAVQKIDLFSNSENMSFLHTKMPQKSPISFFPTTDTPSLLIKSGEMPNTSSKITTATSSTMGNKLSAAFTSESWRIPDIPASESHSSVISTASTSPRKVTGFNFAKSRPNEKISVLPTSIGSSESTSSPAIKISSALPLSSSVSSASVPPAAVSVAISRSTSNTSIDPNNIFSSAAVYSSNQGFKPTASCLPNTASLNSTSVSLKSEIQPASMSSLNAVLDAAVEVGPRLNEPQNRESELKVGPSGKFTHTNEQSSNNISSSSLNAISVSQSEQPSEASMQLSTPLPASASVSSWKNGGMDVGISYEDEMEEEAPETSNMTELSLGSPGGFGTSSIPNPSMPKSNPFGDSYGNVATSSSIFTFSVPSGELFRPASFNFPSSQSSATAQSTNSGAFSGGFSAGGGAPMATPSAFGQPAQIGSGQQVLGSVLGTFGQSRQLGSGLPGSGFAAPSGFGGSSSNSAFSSAGGGGGFASMASTGGGFAGIGSAGGGFAGIASTGGGFGGMGSVGGGFTGVTSSSNGFSGLASPVGGFAGTASTGGGFGAVSSTGGFAGAASGGGFGAFSSQGSGGFAAFGSAGGSKPPELFTQIRK